MFGVLLMIAGLFLLLLSLTPYIPLPFFLIDLFSNFVLQYFCAGVVLIGIISITGEPSKLYIPVTIALLLNIIQIIPYLPWKTAPVNAAQTFKILQANVLYRNVNPDAFDVLIGEEQPDIIFIAEANKHFARILNRKGKLYPFQMQIAKDHHGFGMIIAAKFSLLKLRADRSGDDNKPMISAEFDFHGKTVHMVSIHLANPLNAFDQRSEGFDDLKKHLDSVETENILVAGDFNTTPYAPIFKTFKKKTGLKEARTGLALNNTFHDKLPSFLQIPIDHTLYSGDLNIIDYYKGPNIGSDHTPMVTVISLD